jgi:hypothetical protein
MFYVMMMEYEIEIESVVESKNFILEIVLLLHLLALLVGCRLLEKITVH